MICIGARGEGLITCMTTESEVHNCIVKWHLFECMYPACKRVILSWLINTQEEKTLGIDHIRKSLIFYLLTHDILWFKLVEMSVRGKMLNVINSIHANLKSRVKFDNCVSSDFVCCLVVRQGECLSPILFSMYLNDVEREYILKGA